MADESKMDMKKMMEAYEKLGTPGPEHQMLARMAGSWSTTNKTWMDPQAPPMESTGSCEQKIILGGRFLQQEFTGDMMGKPFTGIGVVGYDNNFKKYVSTWMDSSSTGIMFFEGTGDEDGRTVTQTSSYDDPIMGPMKWRTVTKIEDDNTILFEMYSTRQGSEETKMMEMIYSRKS